MAYVWFSGSRSIAFLPMPCISLLRDCMTRGDTVLVGDCPSGVDTFVQMYLAANDYRNVQVFHIGNRPRQKQYSHWLVESVPGCSYSDKDVFMAKQCDSAVHVWDGVSKGTHRNIAMTPGRCTIFNVSRVPNSTSYTYTSYGG
jgi:hypothetical protein